MRIYLTHCSKEKSSAAKSSGGLFSPDELYTEAGIQQFIAACKQAEVNWAILSNYYGVFFPLDRHAYYEKPLATVTLEEELVILLQFEQKLSAYDEIWFFVRTETFHPFYERVLKSSSFRNRINLFTDLRAIH